MEANKDYEKAREAIGHILENPTYIPDHDTGAMDWDWEADVARIIAIPQIGVIASEQDEPRLGNEHCYTAGFSSGFKTATDGMLAMGFRKLADKEE